MLHTGFLIVENEIFFCKIVLKWLLLLLVVIMLFEVWVFEVLLKVRGALLARRIFVIEGEAEEELLGGVWRGKAFY